MDLRMDFFSFEKEQLREDENVINDELIITRSAKSEEEAGNISEKYHGSHGSHGSGHTSHVSHGHTSAGG